MDLIEKKTAMAILTKARLLGDSRSAKEIFEDVHVVFKIPDNPTNGQILEAVFPHAKIWQSANDICLLIDGQGDAQMFDVDWWDAPYKRGETK